MYDADVETPDRRHRPEDGHRRRATDRRSEGARDRRQAVKRGEQFSRRNLGGDRRCNMSDRRVYREVARDAGGIETHANEQISERMRSLEELRKDMAFIIQDDEDLAHEIVGFSLDCRSKEYTCTDQVWTLLSKIYYSMVSRDLDDDTDEGIEAYRLALESE